MRSKLSPEKYILILAVLVVLVLMAIGILTYHKMPSQSSGRIQIVAGENFWGSIASQIGGNRVEVTSIVSDPNADPHQYESSSVNAKAFAAADYIILNGAGYDSWGDRLIKSNTTARSKILKVADLVGKKEGDNPHFWYSPTYVDMVAAKIEHDLMTIDPYGSSYYINQFNNLENSFKSYKSRINDINQHFAGTKVAATEDIFQYLADATKLNLISPSQFTQAVAEGNDPPTNSVVQFQQQLQNKEPKVLVYNLQTVTPLTESIKKLATEQSIPTIGITETIQPPNKSYQDWMNDEIAALENVLAGQKVGQ